MMLAFAAEFDFDSLIRDHVLACSSKRCDDELASLPPLAGVANASPLLFFVVLKFPSSRGGKPTLTLLKILFLLVVLLIYYLVVMS